MKLRWSAAAMLDRDSIRDYIRRDSPRSALQMDKRLWNAASSLKIFPEMGRSGRVKGTRELVVDGTPYILAYRVEPEAIRIVRIIHTAQRWPREMPQL